MEINFYFFYKKIVPLIIGLAVSIWVILSKLSVYNKISTILVIVMMLSITPIWKAQGKHMKVIRWIILILYSVALTILQLLNLGKL